MKILAVSDKVESHLYPVMNEDRLPDIDLILACGDLPPEYVSFLREKLNVPLFYVRGNHDIRYRESPPFGCTNLHGRLEKVNGIRILGLEGSRWYNGGPVQYREWQMRWLIRQLIPWIWLKGGVDVIITHAPPRHVNDHEDMCHRGFRCFHRLIKWFSPQYFIHGHIHQLFDHPSERVAVVGNTKVINAYGHEIIKLDNG